MEAKTKILFIKTIGAIYALIGSGVMFFLILLTLAGVFSQYTSSELLISIPASVLRIILFFGVGWFAWRQPAIAAYCAWAALVVFVAAASVHAFLLHGLTFALHLIPTFYVVSFLQLIGALILTWLVSNLANANAA